MDDTICDLCSVFLDRVNTQFDLTIPDYLIYNGFDDYFVKVVDKDISEEFDKDRMAFKIKYIFNDNFFLNLEPIVGAVEFVNKCNQEGFDISFLTRVIDWEDHPNQKKEWLQKYFGNLDYELIITEKLRTKRFFHTANYILDDSVNVAKELQNVIMPEKSWNREFIKINNRRSFKSFDELDFIFSDKV